MNDLAIEILNNIKDIIETDKNTIKNNLGEQYLKAKGANFGYNRCLMIIDEAIKRNEE